MGTSTSLGLGWLSAGNDVVGIESHHHVADDIAPLKSLQAGVDSQREWTGEALIQAL